MPMSMSTSDMIRVKRLESKTTEPTVVDSFSPYSQSVPSSSAPNNAGSTVFVISCIDPRFTSAVEEYLLQQLGPGTTYDLFVLAGASLGGRLADNTLPTTGVTAGCPIVDSNQSWRKVLLDHIQVAITLHNVRKVYIIDHLDCGAYGACGLIGDTAENHWTQFNSLRNIILSESYYANGTANGTFKTLGSSTTIFGLQATNNIRGLYFDTPVGSTTQLFEYVIGAATAAAAVPGTLVGTYTFPSSSGAKVLVLGCIDPRFSQTLSSFLINYKEVQFVYDLFILAGSSLGVNQSYNINGALRGYNTIGDAYPNSLLSRQAIGLVGPVGENWGPVFFDHLKLAIQLHGVTEVWVFDHLDCGAYKNIKLASGGLPAATDNDPAQHIPEIQKLEGLISSRYSSLGFKGFIMDTNGLITKVADNKNGIVLDVITYPVLGEFGSSRIRAPASEIIDLRAKASADYVLVREHSGNRSSGFGRQLVRTKLTPVNALGVAPTGASSTTVLQTKVGPLKSTLLNRNRL